MRKYGCAVAILLLTNLACSGSKANYDLKAVQHMDRFIGSTQAKGILAKQGFVVTDQQFKQVFGAYIDHDYGKPSPAKFITVDSVWHTYHVRLEESVKQLEEGQAARLLTFSKKLHEKANGLKKQPDDLYRTFRVSQLIQWAEDQL